MFNRKSKKRGERPRPSTYENRGALYDWVADRVCEGLWDRIVSKTKVNKLKKKRENVQSNGTSSPSAKSVLNL